ncbi:MAG TPA: T9SS type A sorting domain-containing protein [Flavipsychrobacter sp.]
MKKVILLATVCSVAMSEANAQIPFPVDIAPDWNSKTVAMPRSPLKLQTVFVGGVDEVQTTATYGNAAGKTKAKEWHDFIGFVKDTTEGALGWVIVNHEEISSNDMIGDGGGMTSFKIKRTTGDKLEVMEQTLADGRKGKFFNVDFVNTVGETGMNCGGISATKQGRIWTAEEWFRTSNASLMPARDTADFTITGTAFAFANGKTIKKYQNYNWMVEVDPKTGKAIRKQYNWGRAGWEAGVVMDDNKTVYLFEDNTPGILVKFEATTAGDFTKGKLYAYKHDGTPKWIEIEENLDTLMELNRVAVRRGATMFNRLEWGTIANGKLYITETGRSSFTLTSSGYSALGVVSPTLVQGYKRQYQDINAMPFPGSDADAADSVRKGRFKDYYGRVCEFNPANGEIRSYIEGGPYYGNSTSQSLPVYPSIHLSNPDGLATMTIGSKDYLMIQEDMNQRTYNSMPNGFANERCEMYILDASIVNPVYSDLKRVTASAFDAEITGAIQIDAKTILVNSQHPGSFNDSPYNHSLTYAITGFDGSDPVGIINGQEVQSETFSVYPNPTSRELNLSRIMDAAIYDVNGRRLRVYRQVRNINVADLATGTYFIRNEEGETLKFVVQ